MNKTVYLFVLLILCKEIFAQSTNFIFSHLTTKEGLSDNLVNCILKDSRGSLWIGTSNGLNRYDGSHFYVFRKSKDSNSLFNGNIAALCEDRKGNIWGSTEAGIFLYNRDSNIFKNIGTPKRGNDKSFINIFCDRLGNTWATGFWTLLKYDAKNNRFIEEDVIGEYDNLNFNITRNGLLADNSEKFIWISTTFGLVQYEIATGKLFDYKNQPDNPLFAKQSISALAKSSFGYFWCFNNDTKDIILFDPVQKNIIRKINIRHILPNAVGFSLYEDKNNRLWFSSRNDTCLVIDYSQNNRIEKLVNIAEDKMSIANGSFSSVYEDEDGTLWFATISGISKCNPEKSLYKSHQLHNIIPALKQTSISVITEDPKDNSWWLATLDKQVIHYYPKSGIYKAYPLKNAKPNHKGQYPSGIFNLVPLRDIIVITTTTGAWQIKRGKDVVEPFAFFPEGYRDFYGILATSLGDSVCFFTDHEKILRINVRTGNYTLYTYSEELLKDKIHGIGFMFTDAKGKIWAPSNLGRLAHADSEKIVTIKLTKDDDIEFSGYFNTLDIDKQGNIWVVSTGFGLYRYEPLTGAVKYWNETDGLQTPYIQKNKIDNNGNIWLMAFSDASVFSPASNDFFHFHIPFGENTTNYYNSMNKLSNGNIVGSINNEMFEFFPDRLNLKPAKRMPLISMINVSGKEVLISNQEKMVLMPEENTLRFKFGILTDPGLFPYEFEYRLDGAEKTWTRSSSLNEAVYNNLSPGNYTFRVLARGKNNTWQTEERKFYIQIKAPFYKTEWFWMIIGGILIAALVFFYRFRLNKQMQILSLETKAQELEKEKTLVMYENLKQHLNPHFLFNSLTSLSGLIETDQQVAGNFLEQMSGIYRYILKNGNNETVSLKDEIDFVNLYINLQQTRFKKGLAVNINIPEEYHHFKIAPVTLQNLIENAIKHNIIDAGSPLVIDIFNEGDYLVVKNNLQRKKMVETSNKKGLAQFTSLYHYLSELPVVIEETDKYFLIKVPLI